MSQTTEEKLVENIQKLQEIERKLYQNLEKSIANGESIASKNIIITEINRISELRINLYKTLSGLNSNYQQNLNNTNSILGEQTKALGIVERELNENKEKLQQIDQDNINKMRMVQINTYYGQRFQEHTELMKILIYIFVPIILFTALFFYGFLPSSIYYVIIIIIALIGIYYIVKITVSIMSRDRMNYQEYDWFFNSNKAPTDDNIELDFKSPWETIDVTTCIGQECCLPNYLFDSKNNKCTLVKKTEGFGPMLVNQNNPIKNMDDEEYAVFTKYANTKNKPDVFMNSNVMPTYSSTSISNDSYEDAYEVK